MLERVYVENHGRECNFIISSAPKCSKFLYFDEKKKHNCQIFWFHAAFLFLFFTHCFSFFPIFSFFSFLSFFGVFEDLEIGFPTFFEQCGFARRSSYLLESKIHLRWKPYLEIMLNKLFSFLTVTSNKQGCSGDFKPNLRETILEREYKT